MKQSKLFRTWREGENEDEPVGGSERMYGSSREENCVPTPAVLLMLSETGEKNAPLGTCYRSAVIFRSYASQTTLHALSVSDGIGVGHR